MAVAAEEVGLTEEEQRAAAREATKPVFARTNFAGCVQMREYFEPADGRVYRNVLGTVSIYRDLEVIGFPTRGTEANWVAVVEGKTERVVILGCQIRSVTSYQKHVGDAAIMPTKLGNDTYEVP